MHPDKGQELNGAGQNGLPRGAITRLTALLLVSCTIAFGWEAFKNPI